MTEEIAFNALGGPAAKLLGKVVTTIARPVANFVKPGVKKLTDSARKLIDDVFSAGRHVCSFTRGTVVLMCDGSYQPIETVQEGQWVLARDELTGEVACKEVVHPYANPDRSILVVELQAEDGTTEVLETTDNHPFYVADRGWTRVDELAAGDLIPSADGQLLTVVSTMWTNRIETVYNFGVDGFSNYFIAQVEAWVHNCYAPKGPLAGRRVGHTFSKHGRHMTKQLTLEAKNSRHPQGQWLDEEAAEQLIADNLGRLSHGTIEIEIPREVGRVILPNGSFRAATKARLVPSGSGVKTAYPILE